MAKNRRRVGANSKWCVEANTDQGKHGTKQGWKPIYCTRSKAQAQKDARKWFADVGQDTRVVPGPGRR